MATENPQQQQRTHQPTTFGYGDVVLYSQNGKICNAQVLQAQVVQVPDRSAPGGFRNEEHLALIFLKPEAGKTVMSQIEMDNAIGKAFGVQQLTEENKVGWIRASVSVDAGIPAATQEQGEYAGRHSG